MQRSGLGFSTMSTPCLCWIWVVGLINLTELWECKPLQPGWVHDLINLELWINLWIKWSGLNIALNIYSFGAKEHWPLIQVSRHKGNDSAAHATLTCLCTLCIQVRAGHDCTPFISKRAFWSAVRGWWGHSLRLLVNAKQSFLSAPERNDRTAMEHPTFESRLPPRCGGVHWWRLSCWKMNSSNFSFEFLQFSVFEILIFRHLSNLNCFQLLIF